MANPKPMAPALDALFDEAQLHGVQVAFAGTETVLLSQKDFDTLLETAGITIETIQHVPVPRPDKPMTYMVKRPTFNAHAERHPALLGLVQSQVNMQPTLH